LTKIDETLAERGSTYGDFREQARITYNLKRAAQDSPNWSSLPDYMREGLDMVFHKLARLLNGDPFYDDNLHDVVGYTKLMQDRAKQDRDNGVKFVRASIDFGVSLGSAPVVDVDDKADRESIEAWKEKAVRETEHMPYVMVEGKFKDFLNGAWRYTSSFSQNQSLIRVLDIVEFCDRNGKGVASLAIEDVKNLVNLSGDALRGVPFVYKNDTPEGIITEMRERLQRVGYAGKISTGAGGTIVIKL